MVMHFRLNQIWIDAWAMVVHVSILLNRNAATRNYTKELELCLIKLLLLSSIILRGVHEGRMLNKRLSSLLLKQWA